MTTLKRPRKPWRWTSHRDSLRTLLLADGYAKTWTFIDRTYRASFVTANAQSSAVRAMTMSDQKIELQSVAVRIGVQIPDDVERIHHSLLR